MNAKSIRIFVACGYLLCATRLLYGSAWETLLCLSTGTLPGQVGYLSYSDEYGGHANDVAQSFAVDNKGNIYIADTYNKRVQVFNSSGIFIFSFSTADKPIWASGFNICVGRDNYIYVSEVSFRGGKIAKFDARGKFLRAFANVDKEEERFWHADQIEADSKGSVYIYDMNLNRIQKYDSCGRISMTVTCDGYFALDTDDRLYISDKVNGGINFYDTSSKKLKLVKNISTPFLIDRLLLKVDKKGNLYMGGGGKITVVSPDGERILHEVVLPRYYGAMSKFLEIDNAGNIYVANSDYDSDGRIFFKISRYIWQ